MKKRNYEIINKCIDQLDIFYRCFNNYPDSFKDDDLFFATHYNPVRPLNRLIYYNKLEKEGILFFEFIFHLMMNKKEFYMKVDEYPQDYNENLSIIIDTSNFSTLTNWLEAKVLRKYPEYETVKYNNKTREKLLNENFDKKVIVVLQMGLLYMLHENTIIINPNLYQKARSNVTLDHILSLLPSLEGYKPNKDTFENKVIYNQDVLKFINSLYEKATVINIDNQLHNMKKDIYKQNYQNTENQIRKALQNLQKLYEDSEKFRALIYQSEKKSDVAFTLQRLTKSNAIFKVQLQNNYSNLTLKVFWNPIQIQYFDEQKLKMSAQNIVYNQEKRLAAIKEVLNYNKKLWTLPFVSKIIITADKIEIYNFPLECAHVNGMNITWGCLYNKHPVYDDYRGCLGTFRMPITDAIMNQNISKILLLLQQFYGTITINDPLGNNAVQNLIISDNDGNIDIEDNPYIKNKIVEYGLNLENFNIYDDINISERDVRW